MAPQRKNFPMAKYTAKGIKGMLTKMSRSRIKPLRSTESWSVKDMAKLQKKMDKTSTILKWMIRNTTQTKAHKMTRQETKLSQWKKPQKGKGFQQKTLSGRKMSHRRFIANPPLLSPIPEEDEEELVYDKLKTQVTVTSSPQFSTSHENSITPTSPPIVYGPQNFYSEEDEILLSTYGC